MKELRSTELAADVVAWHNRNPLARHIRVQHVHSLGYVMLPFVDADAAAPPSPAARPAPAGGGEVLPPETLAGSLRERAMARAQLMNPEAAAQADDAPPRAAAPAHLRPVFDGDFLTPHKAKAVQRWATQHAVAQNTPRGDMPVRRIAAETGWTEADVLPRWVLTAQVEVGRSKTRVLVGPGAPPAVLGRRLISPARTLAVFALAGVLLGIGSWLLDPAAGRAASAPKQTMAAATAATPPAPAASPAGANSPGLGSSAARASAASAAAPGPGGANTRQSPPAAMAPAAAGPVDVEPSLGQIDLPYIGPRAEARRRQAQEGAASAAALSATPAPAVTPTPTPTPTPAAPALTPPQRQATTPPASTGPVFAVATRLLRTRSESDQVATAMRELLSNAAGTPVRVEVLPAGDDWRVVGWPYTDRSLADKARALLVSRGMKVEVIDF